MICFHFSIFEPLETAVIEDEAKEDKLWFAFKLVSLNHWKQRINSNRLAIRVVICFQISIFEPLETALRFRTCPFILLWFAFKLVSLNHWKQLLRFKHFVKSVVICFQISIFEPLETAYPCLLVPDLSLWFAFKLVSLNHWKQHDYPRHNLRSVVICFQISIFEPLETALTERNHVISGCDLLSN